ncbi:MAG: hypothetical protein ABI416_08990 [Ginsengibacter sp.]
MDFKYSTNYFRKLIATISKAVATDSYLRCAIRTIGMLNANVYGADTNESAQDGFIKKIYF